VTPRRPILLVAALLTAYAAIAVLSVIVIQQRSELQRIEATMASSAGRTAASVPVASPSAVSIASPRPLPSATPGFPQMVKVTDNLGHTWIYGPNNSYLWVKPGTVMAFTAVAMDAMNRPLQYAYYAGTSPSVSVLCNWGGPSCSWTVPQQPGTQTEVVVAVRAANTVDHRLQNCGYTDACDDLQPLLFNISP
jgi:hypothetical protein